MENITTTRGETFTYEQSCNLAWMIYVRFGRDLSAATDAWRRLLQNSSSEMDFAKLIQDAPMSDDKLADYQLSLIRKITVVLARDRPITMSRFYDAHRDFRTLPVWMGDELVKLVARTKAAQPVTYVELLAEEYAPFVERILNDETLGPTDYPVFIAPESAQL